MSITYLVVQRPCEDDADEVGGHQGQGYIAGGQAPVCSVLCFKRTRPVSATVFFIGACVNQWCVFVIAAPVVQCSFIVRRWCIDMSGCSGRVLERLIRSLVCVCVSASGLERVCVKVRKFMSLLLRLNPLIRGHKGSYLHCPLLTS